MICILAYDGCLWKFVHDNIHCLLHGMHVNNLHSEFFENLDVLAFLKIILCTNITKLDVSLLHRVSKKASHFVICCNFLCLHQYKTCIVIGKYCLLHYLILLTIRHESFAFSSVNFGWFWKKRLDIRDDSVRAGLLQQVLEMMSLCLYTCSSLNYPLDNGIVKILSTSFS